MAELVRLGPTSSDQLAVLNQALIQEEGSDTRLSLDELSQRMRGWLAGYYQVVAAKDSNRLLGYCLFAVETNRVYVRQLYVVESARLSGYGKALLAWVEANTPEQLPLHLKVLSGNHRVLGFYQKLGYQIHAHELRKRT
ncbi:GNAT family N-acetyltransferase [Saccharospirillum mangrovi]|uniref:GNAT family N-acetyltransferase n=1 Tax=Saccharospirillum mangrovi TaxID=2161747 RepID=UPI000D33B5AB|nr:GNAT family N-acetyltransferase [Saccharospirillum mangrovi]